MTVHGATLILEERIRQQTSEGYSEQSDTRHLGKELARAALVYLVWYIFQFRYPGRVYPHIDRHTFAHEQWPFTDGFFKPGPDDIRLLVKAGALVAAEIDRIEKLPSV